MSKKPVSEGKPIGPSRKQPSTSMSRKSEKSEKSGRGATERGGETGTGVGERKRRSSRRRVRERFCGDGACAPGWPTFGPSAAFLSSDECFSPAAARPHFRLPRSPLRS
eukprot:3872217-Pleurochrysis_carterae.AAC.1